MANEIKVIADKAAKLVAEADAIGKSCLRKYIEAGLALIELKDACKHGEFGPSCEAVGITRGQSHRYMRTAKSFIERGDDIENLPDMWIDAYIGWESKRALSGKFVKGNPGGPGRGHKAPPKDLEAEPKQYIYAIINPLIAGWVKVGMSDNPRRRLKDMQTYSPADYELVFKAELPDGFTDNTIHPFLTAHFNRSREWFECPADDAITLIEYLLEHTVGGRSAA